MIAWLDVSTFWFNYSSRSLHYDQMIAMLDTSTLQFKYSSCQLHSHIMILWLDSSTFWFNNFSCSLHFDSMIAWLDALSFQFDHSSCPLHFYHILAQFNVSIFWFKYFLFTFLWLGDRMTDYVIIFFFSISLLFESWLAHHLRSWLCLSFWFWYWFCSIRGFFVCRLYNSTQFLLIIRIACSPFVLARM